MAKIYPANVAPDALPRVRGVLLTRISRGVIIGQKWPRKRGPPSNAAVQYTSKQFSLASQMAANAEPMSMETARFFSRNTVWLPRDLLVRAAYGNLWELVDPTGAVWTQAFHGYPGSEPPARPPVQTWQANQVNSVLAGATNTASYAFKGTIFTPDVPMELDAVSAMLTPLNGASYKAICAALNGSNVIQSLVAGTPRTISGTTKKLYEFQMAATLAAGTRYAILVGRTDGANNYALPIPSGSGSNWLIPCQDLGYGRLAQNTPAVGHTVENGATSFPLSLLLTF